MAEVKSTKKDQPMLDPIAYRSDYSEDNIIGPEGTTVELTQKYTGEGTDNVYHPYNSTMTIDQLDPNYQYGQPAKDINRIDDSYLSRRNDQIASALYNEGRTTKEDVIAFLQGQNNWFNSTPEDRATTTENIYNRIGQLSQNQNQQDNTQYDTNEMRGELNKDTTGKIFGKTSANEGKAEKGIQTLSDANSIDQIMNNARIANVEALIAMDDNAIAASIVSGTVPYGEQALTDLQKRMPDKYLNIQAKVKEIKTQNTVNAIASGKYEDVNSTADVSDVYSQATSYAVNNASGSISATQLLKTIDAKLIESTSAQSAKELMMTIKENEAVLKNRLRNLNKEANTVFKGDVPDYIAKAYVNNKSQEIQNQLSILADRYSSAYDIYKTELAHAEWQSEYELKKDNLELDWYKAKNSTSTTSSTTNTNYSVAERNNNPTNMTVGFMEWAGAELGVDYEVSTDSFWSNGKQLYYAKLIGDPVQTTINVLNKAIAAGKNPFNTTSWSYIQKLGLTVDGWKNMSQEDKENKIKEWLRYEGGNMDNMAYYVNQKAEGGQQGEDRVYYNPAWEDMLRQIATGQVKLNSATAKTYAEMMGTDVRGMGKMVEQYKADQLANGKAAGKDLLYLMAELQILFEDKGLTDDGKFDTSAWNSISWGAIGRKHDQLKEQLKLNKVTEARDKGATFGQMTEYEWKVLENAATALNMLKLSDKEYTDEFQKLMEATYLATFGHKPTEQEWYDFVKERRGYQGFSISAGSTSTQSVDDKLSQIGTGSVGTDINFMDVVENGR